MMINNTTPMAQISYSLDDVRRSVEAVDAHDLSQVPVIGISANHNVDENTLTDTYVESVRRAGGIPLIIPFDTDPEILVRAVRNCDGLIMSGGGDLLPMWFGEEPSPKMGKGCSRKDLYDLTLIESAIRFSIPVLGICRGMQLCNVVLGGELYQDIESERGNVIGHSQTASRYEVWHKVSVVEKTRLHDLLGEEEVAVNSFHHQAVSTLPPFGRVTATAPDGIIEGVDYYPEYNILGVQWHPEALACHGRAPHNRLFDFIVAEARLYRRARRLHNNIISIDTHCDTPMLFSGTDGYDFTARAEKALVDLPRMRDGGLDTSFMVAYIPQGELTEKGYEQAFEYTDRTLDAIDDVMRATNGQVIVAHTAEEIVKAKAKGCKAVVKGIENGYPIARDLSRLSHFADKGVRYITLSHNGDNDICDSASRSSQTHGGLSDFGREVVREMNRLGILIDLSHAGSSTVRDVLALSSAPVIASHSSCRAICDHPRNLTDEEIMGIAATGGVIQMCMYKGFVNKESEQASILDFVDHICHAYKLVGADHIGIGTDFDGDGEVIGCRNASHILRITIELLRRGFSDGEIGKMWGENVLRVLENVEKSKERQLINKA